ncbi:MAG: ribonuclease H-like domain-containing protein [Thermofilaceae archaeon]
MKRDVSVIRLYVRTMLELGYSPQAIYKRLVLDGVEYSFRSVQRLRSEYGISGPYRDDDPISFLEWNAQATPEALREHERVMTRLERAEQRQQALDEAFGARLFSVAMFDIETTHLRADFGFILCAAVKPLGESVQVFRIDQSPEYAKEPWNDRWLVEQIREAIAQYDIIVTYYGERFDLPFLRTRLLKHGLPLLPRFRHVDLYKIPRYDLRLHSNTLESLSMFLEGKTEKTRLMPEVWVRASCGDRTALDVVADHCARDVGELEKVFVQLKPLIRAIVLR